MLLRLLAATAILLSFNTAFSQSDEEENPWEKVEYSFVSLFHEYEFNADACMRDQREFTACVTALNYLSKLLPEPMQIQVDAGSQDQLKFVEYDESQAMDDDA